MARFRLLASWPHRDADTPVRVLPAKSLRQPRSFLPKEQPAIISKDCLGIVPWRFRRGQPQIRGRIDFKEVVQPLIDLKIHHIPVIQPGPTHGFFTDIKTQRLDQMEAAAGSGAGLVRYSRYSAGSLVLPARYSAQQDPHCFAGIIVFHFIGNFNCNLVEKLQKIKKQGHFSFCPQKAGFLFFYFLLNYSFPVLALILMSGFLF